MMAKIPQKFMGLLGKFADSLDYNDLPKNWADNPEVVQAAEELYRDMGTESPFFKAWFGNWPAAKAYQEVGNKKRLEDAFKTPTEGSAPQASRLILGQQLDDVKRSSRVVDGEGRPLIVHHNTDHVFDTFSKDRINSSGGRGGHCRSSGAGHSERSGSHAQISERP